MIANSIQQLIPFVLGCGRDVDPDPEKLKNGEGFELQHVVRHLHCLERTERSQKILNELATALEKEG